MSQDDEPCTCCKGTGITIQTERRCACQPPNKAPAPSPVNDMNARINYVQQVLLDYAAKETDLTMASFQICELIEVVQAAGIERAAIFVEKIPGILSIEGAAAAIRAMKPEI